MNHSIHHRDTGEAVRPFANYKAHRRDGDRLYISGQVAYADGGFPLTGRVGAELTLEEGKLAARICALNVLAHAEEFLGTLERVRSVLKITVFVSTAEGFLSHHLVADGASEALLEKLGAAGEHSRSAVGVARLPMDSPVEVEAVLLIAGGEEA
ncbi:RidA family protein [Sphingomonas sp. BLCC-B65]|nr:RidA family protein [Sphingomonas sp. BLCC-B65]